MVDFPASYVSLQECMSIFRGVTLCYLNFDPCLTPENEKRWTSKIPRPLKNHGCGSWLVNLPPPNVPPPEIRPY